MSAIFLINPGRKLSPAKKRRRAKAKKRRYHRKNHLLVTQVNRPAHKGGKATVARKRKRSRKGRKRSYHRGRRNPATIYRVNGRRRSNRRRGRRYKRNQGVVAATTGTMKKLASRNTAEFVVAGIGGYAVMGFVEAQLERIPAPPSPVTTVLKKLAAAGITYGISTLITKSKVHRTSVFSGVALRFGIESLQMFMPGLAARIGLAPMIVVAPVAASGNPPVATMSGFAGNIGGPFINTALPRRLQGHMAASGLN